jgi:cytoskeletal protein RodZ
MQLNEIFEENSVKAISKRTNISEENLEALLAGDFDALKKVKTLGFISIIEREYKADLSTLKEQALSHYIENSDEEESVTLGLPIMEEKKGKSKLFLLFVLMLLGYASWYFFTQFDKKQLNELLPFSEEKISQVLMPKEVNDSTELSIESVIAPAHTDTNITKTGTNTEESLKERI